MIEKMCRMIMIGLMVCTVVACGKNTPNIAEETVQNSTNVNVAEENE